MSKVFGSAAREISFRLSSSQDEFLSGFIIHALDEVIGITVEGGQTAGHRSCSK
jgi:hypothetical protein